LGVHNIRDGGRNSSQIQLINRQTGVRLDLIAEGDLKATISTGKALAASGALMAFEGPNEPAERDCARRPTVFPKP
jgi:fructose-1,6-bisphosphatase/sedoheptulose 1,7-bisphosphatase-like protein